MLCLPTLCLPARQIQGAERVVAFTGAGISTACGIPDFRGPKGIWTLQRDGQPLPRLQTSFVYAKPSLTHMVSFRYAAGVSFRTLVFAEAWPMHMVRSMRCWCVSSGPNAAAATGRVCCCCCCYRPGQR